MRRIARWADVYATAGLEPQANRLEPRVSLLLKRSALGVLGRRWWPKATHTQEARPLIPCEYAHAMGNSSGNLEEWWAAFQKLNHAQVFDLIISHSSFGSSTSDAARP